MSGAPAPGPAWLGIGAQRSGTTWFTSLLCQHAEVDLGVNGKKEQHLLHKVGDGRESAVDYVDLFPADGLRRGEWTPQYLRHSSTPAAAARILGRDALVLVLLRDPVERFLSAMRLTATRGKSPWPYPVPITVQTWSGCYADQLAMWRQQVGAERMIVLGYEQVRQDPQSAADAVWQRLGLASQALEAVERPSRSSSHVDWEPPEGLIDSLRVLYAPQAERVAQEWGLDVSRWTATLPPSSPVAPSSP